MNWLHRARAAVRDYGVLSVLLLLSGRVARRLGVALKVHSYVLVAQPVAPVAGTGRHARRFSTRRIERGEPVLRELDRPGAVIESRFDQGAVCLGLFRGERFVGCAWLCVGPYLEDEVRCRFVPLPQGSTCWDFDVFLVEDERLGFAFPALWSAINAWLGERDIAWTMSRISAFNPASLRAHARLGARRIGRLSFLTLGSAQLAFGSVRPWIHLCRRADARPVVELRPPG